MFTTGSKLFIGATVLGLTGTLIYGVTQDNSKLGTVGLVSATLALLFVMGMNLWVRDSNVAATDTNNIATSPAAQATPARSMWPLIAALATALVPVGLVIGRGITWIAVIVVLIATVEWMVLGWSERASGDAAYNASVRKRVMHPLELPILGALGLGVIIFSFSRIMLRLPSTAGAIAFGAAAAVVLLFGSLLAMKRNVGHSIVAALCSIGAIGIVGAGVASAIAGERKIPSHELPSYAEGTCGADEGEADDHASRAVASKSNLTATVILKDGSLHAEVIGVIGNQETVTLPMSSYSYVRFVNLDDEARRLVVDLGAEIVTVNGTETKQPEQLCTQAVGKDGAQFIVVRPTRPSTSSESPFTFTVPGIDDAVTIVVP